jgi:hypothetical protein
MFKAWAWVGIAALSFAIAGCGDESGDEAASGGGNDKTPAGHSLTLNVTLKEHDGDLAFMTPVVSIAHVERAALVGKPYLIASYPAGFSPGNDPAIDHTWGHLPDDLAVRYTTPSTYQDGPYDMVFILYTNTEITQERMDGPAQYAPPAKKGDLATFTGDTSAVRQGDPKIPPGLVRLNVESADAEISVENRTLTDPMDMAQIGAAYTNTVLLLP